MNIRIDRREVDVLAADLARAGAVTAAKSRRVVEGSGEHVAELAQRNVPVRRAQLMRSITSDMVDAFTVEVGPENRLGGGYGHIVENGDSRRAPQPYLSPALDEAEPDFVRDMENLTRGLL